jgi:hypothetical protein
MKLEELLNNELLKIEFEDLIYSDKDFNYSRDEFEQWIIDLVLPFEAN